MTRKRITMTFTMVVLSLLLLFSPLKAAAEEVKGREYLDRINSGVEYPNSSEFLEDFMFATVKAPSGHSVLGFGSADHAGKSYTVLNGEQVLILAERRDYDCVIVLSEKKGRWINADYLVNAYYANERAIDSAIGYSESSPLPLTEEFFPDESFCRYLRLFDENGDGILSSDEQRKVSTIDCYRQDIQSLSGIEYFSNLTELSVDDNLLSELNVSQNTKLKKLTCGRNQLEKLDLSRNPELRYLSCEYNQLKVLSVDNNANLQYLDCSRNALTSLDLSTCTALSHLICSKNLIGEIDVTASETLRNALQNGNKTSNKQGEIAYTAENPKAYLAVDSDIRFSDSTIS